MFEPEIGIQKKLNTVRTVGRYGSFNYRLCEVNDLLRWEGDHRDSFIHYHQGLLGERLLTVVLEAFIGRMRETCPDVSGASVVRERVRHREKGYVVNYNDSYILKHDRQTTFVLVSKPIDDSPRSEYQQEKYGLITTEIDGIAYLYFNGYKQLIIAEVSTRGTTNQLSINAWLKGKTAGLEEKVKHNVHQTLFKPLRSLFPKHRFLYFIMAPENTLWFPYKGRLRLRKRTELFYRAISTLGIDVMFVPIPKLDHTLHDIAENLYSVLPLTREVLESIRRRQV